MRAYLFNTPYSGVVQENLKMSGVIHAQMVSQILGAVIDGRDRYFGFLPSGLKFSGCGAGVW